MQITVRLAAEADLPRVNELRQQVNELHAGGQPDIFRPGFDTALRDYLYTIWNDPQQHIVVAEAAGAVCGYAILNHIRRPETPYMYARDFLDIDEFGVDAACHRQGVATAMLEYIRGFMAECGISRLELNMWEFNKDALAFYEAAGFRTYRRYMVLE